MFRCSFSSSRAQPAHPGFVRLLMHSGFIRTRLLHGHYRALLLLLWLGLRWFIRAWRALIDHRFFYFTGKLASSLLDAAVGEASQYVCLAPARLGDSLLLVIVHLTKNGLETYNKTNTASIFLH